MTAMHRSVRLGSIFMWTVMLATGLGAHAWADPYRTEVRTGPSRPDAAGEPGEGRAASTVSRRQLRERQVRSTPEALGWTPGVAVQQTAHGQGSPYVRGVTGRRTLLLFDGLRLNHALFRQGPNQYLFTVDPGSLAGLGVVRGSAGVELGANAIGGAVLLRPLEALPTEGEGLRARSLGAYRHATADGEHAGRVQAELWAGSHWAALFGVGGRSAGRLESAGPVGHLDRAGRDPALKEVPRLQADGRTQLGTGFDVWTADGRLVRRVGEQGRATVAAYLFRQNDSPRTDQCPAPEDPDDHCLMYEEQFRTHVYSKLDLQRLTATLSWQRQHERRANDTGYIVNGGRDDIDVLEARMRASLRPIKLGEGLRLRLPYGVDATREHVSSAAWFTLTDSEVTRTDSRGQYVDGSRYHQGGAWVAPRLDLGRAWTLRAGGRWALAAAGSPADEASDTAAVDRQWSAGLLSAGAIWRATDRATVTVGVDQGFRPPNLDDLTARQLTGQGRQLENPDLEPERSVSAELGVELAGRRWFGRTALFRTWLTGAMERRRTTCPAGDRPCAAARHAPPVSLENLPGVASLHGVEADLGWRPGGGLELRSFATWSQGEDGQGEPLSRVPPLQGGGEATWRQAGTGNYIGTGLRWSADQDRLSQGDELDSRIPYGGTPGFAVAQLRFGLRAGDRLRLRAVLDNILDSPWRVHGAGVLGPGTSATLSLEITP